MFFINPLFLFAMAAGTLPVIVHFMFRKRAKTLYFPSLMFLRQLDREVIRKRRLQEILIMILRILVLVLFVIFLAKPIIRASLFFGRSDKSVVIIIDDSYSMRAEDDKVLFEKARERAVSIIGNLRSGDKAAIIPTSGIGIDNVETVSMSSDLEYLRRTADSLAPGFGPANLDSAFNRARELLKKSGEENTLIFLITDMQRKNWLGVREPEKEKKIPLVIVDVGSEKPQTNAAIIDIEIHSTPDDMAGRLFNFKVKLRNFSPEDKDLSLGMYTISEQLVDETQVGLKAGEEKEIKLVFRPGDSGWHTGYFRISDDALSVDNVRYYALQLRDSSRVGIFAGHTLAAGDFDQYFFLSRTIDPLEQGYPFSVEKLSDINAEDLSEFDVVLFPTMPDFDSVSFANLRRYIRDGGNALFFVERGFSKNRLEDLCGTGSEIGDFEKGIFKIGKEAFGLSRLFLDVDFFERLPISLSESSNSYPIASFQDGKPFVIERLYGDGTIIIVTTGYNLDMTNLPFRHASVPLLYNLLFRLMKESEVRRYICGEALEVETTWDIIAVPDETTFEISDERSEYILSEPGLYVARSEEGRNYVTARIAAANVDAEEGDLARVGYEEFESLVPFSMWEKIESNEDIRQRIEKYSRGTPLWNYFLYAAIICFFVELFMANRAGRRV